MIASQKIGGNFMGALNYNLKKMNHPDPKLRAELLDTNFSSLDITLIKKEVELVRNLRSKLNKHVYHTSLNFSKEDLLDNQKLLDIAHQYLENSGYRNHQYFIFRHNDADHPHVHLLVNRIAFDGSVVSDSNNYKKSEAILRTLEAQYGLTKVEPSSQSLNKSATKGELEMVLRTGKPSNKMVLQELLKTLINAPNLSLRDLINKGEQVGINFLFNQASTGRVTGVTYFHDGFKAKGQALGNQFKWAEIIKKVNYEQARDGQEISQANNRTTAKFGSKNELGEYGRAGIKEGGGSKYSALSEYATENVQGYGEQLSQAGGNNPDTRSRFGEESTAISEDWYSRNNHESNSERTIKANQDVDILDSISVGSKSHSFIDPNIFGMISDEVDLKIKRKRKR